MIARGDTSLDVLAALTGVAIAAALLLAAAMSGNFLLRVRRED
jgi:hypothetical protein